MSVMAPSLPEIRNTAPPPRVPASLQETGLAADQVEQLVVKTLYGGEANGLALADRIRLPFPILEPIVERVRAQQLVEVRGSSGSGSEGYRYALTDAGRDRARLYMEVSQYVGPAPVPLAAYVAEMRALAAARVYMDRERLRQGFSHLIVSDVVLEQLGPVARRLGGLRGHSRAADSLAHVMDSLASQPPTPSTQSLTFIVWDNPPIVIGAGSYLDRLAALAGARNVFHDVGSPSAQVSIETIAARDPDFVAVLSDSAVSPRYASRPEWRVVRAVRRGRFVFLPGQLFGRPGPRVAQAIRELRRRLEAAR